MAKVKERILKAAKEKQLITYKGNLIRLSADFSAENLQARGERLPQKAVGKIKQINLDEALRIVPGT